MPHGTEVRNSLWGPVLSYYLSSRDPAQVVKLTKLEGEILWLKITHSGDTGTGIVRLERTWKPPRGLASVVSGVLCKLPREKSNQQSCPAVKDKPYDDIQWHNSGIVILGVPGRRLIRVRLTR